MTLAQDIIYLIASDMPAHYELPSVFEMFIVGLALCIGVLILTKLFSPFSNTLKEISDDDWSFQGLAKIVLANIFGIGFYCAINFILG